MHAYNISYLFDAGISLATAYLGVGYGIIALVAVIFLEAKVMRKYFAHLDFSTSIKYSLLLNLVSTLFGIPLLYLGGISLSYPQTLSDTLTSMAVIFTLAVFNIFAAIQMFQQIVIAFLITLVVELSGLFILMKPKPTWKNALGYSMRSNFLSYLVVFLTPLVFELGLAFLSIFFSQS